MIDDNLLMTNKYKNTIRLKYFDTEICPICGKFLVHKDKHINFLILADFRCTDQKCKFNNQFKLN